ncbi:MAG: AAA family ATPase [Flavobacteriaceae bacterium]|nr:AAA family ATPase [Flavobacteriaceae bacterium]
MTQLTAEAFLAVLIEKFPHSPTSMQQKALQLITDFTLSAQKDTIFLLKGYAGTGKTTLIGTLVTQLWQTKKAAVLMAPTGRAAKVMSNYSGTQAFTIHKKIYVPRKNKGGGVTFVLGPNKHKDTLFIVDEASMIPDQVSDSKLYEQGSLLEDLYTYVQKGHRCQLMLIGDTAQLPPVHLELSPALQKDTLELRFDAEVISLELDEVVRQELNSGILENATYIRHQLQQGVFDSLKFDVEPYTDIVRLIDGYSIQDAIDDSYNSEGKEETVFIVRSNKRANQYNEQIRSKILFLEQELAAGDYMMVVKNNYFWLTPNSQAGFIANGDILEILEIFEIKSLYGFRFAKVKVQMVDYPNQRPFETVLLLDTIKANSPSLSYEDGNKLYQEVLKDYEHETSKYKKFLSVKNNPYFNALQVKFSYAITCHKSQGGQWDTVFVEQPYLPNGLSREYFRWLYTAVTRARKKLYLIGFKDDFFVA